MQRSGEQEREQRDDSESEQGTGVRNDSLSVY
jgi:hypothetical protein